MHARSMIQAAACLYSKARILYFSSRPRYPPPASLPSTRRKNAFPRDLLAASKRRSRKREKTAAAAVMKFSSFRSVSIRRAKYMTNLVRRFLMRDGCTQGEKRSQGKGKYFYHVGAHLSGSQRRDAFCFSVSAFPGIFDVISSGRPAEFRSIER